MKIKAPAALNYEQFSSTHNDPKPAFGLPRDIRFCRGSLISNQCPQSCVEFKNKPGDIKNTLPFDQDGFSDAWRAKELKDSTDFSGRDDELRELCDKFRSRDGSYDCLVSGSGGKDSFYQTYVLKYEYGMNPLTVTWAPNIYTDWGWKNFQSWIHSGFDNYLHTP